MSSRSIIVFKEKSQPVFKQRADFLVAVLKQRYILRLTARTNYNNLRKLELCFQDQLPRKILELLTRY